MALPILDGNQSATTLSSVVAGGEHIVAHSVVSLGTQAIANITSAISGTSVCVGSISISGTPSVTGSVSVLNFPASQSTTFGAVTGSVSVLNFPASQAVTFGQAIVSASNITGLNNSVGTDGNTPTSTNFIKIGGHQDGSNQVEHIVHVSAGGAMKVDASDSTVTFGTAVVTGSTSVLNFPTTQTVTFTQASVTFGLISGTVTANPTGTQTIAGTVTANVSTFGAFGGTLLDYNGANTVLNVGIQKIGNTSLNLVSYFPVEVYVASNPISASNPVPSRILIGTGSGSAVSAGNPMPISGTVTIGASTSQIGSVTASISGTVPISISSVTVGNSVTIGSLPAISGTVTANLSISSTALTSGSFTSLTSATLVPANTARKMATVYNLGAGQLFINAGVSATTLGGGFMVALSSGDFYECNYTTTTLSAIFANAGTASWVSY